MCVHRARSGPLTVRDERCGLPPFSRHDKFGEWFAVARRALSSAKLVGQRSGVTRIADGDRGHRLPALRDLKNCASLLWENASHLVNTEAAGSRLDSEARTCGADVVKGMAVGLIVVMEGEPGDGNGQDRRLSGPERIPFLQDAGQAGEILGIVLGGNDVSPRLVIETGGRPTSRFEEAAQDLRRDGSFGESARAPAALQDVLYREIVRSRIFHAHSFRFVEDPRRAMRWPHPAQPAVCNNVRPGGAANYL